jgi:hypothetical protein
MDLNTLKEYIKIHKISLEQDLDECMVDWAIIDDLAPRIETLQYVLELIDE